MGGNGGGGAWVVAARVVVARGGGFVSAHALVCRWHGRPFLRVAALARR